jgi:hypothetical protein
VARTGGRMIPDRKNPERLAAVLLLSTGPHIAQLCRDEGLEEPLYDVAELVVDTAHGEGMAYHEIALRPWETVRVVRHLWKSLPRPTTPAGRAA